MNQRIQELKKQAFVKGHWSADGERFIGDHMDIDKFAELIVRECLMLVYERQERAPTDDDGYFKVALDMVSKDIEQHFGVEE